MTGGNVFADWTHIGAGLQPRWQQNVSHIVDAYIFLHEDDVRAFRHRRAGKYADRDARLERFTRQSSGLDSSPHRKRIL